ncbi:MAG: LCP family protein, partial [Myxococcales bacterium]|nr:LCP family protein [Myxococcales bacterium]
GLPLLRRTLQDQLGIRIDRYARVDFAGFTGLIDHLGGVDVDVECPIMDCFWIDGTDKPCVMMQVDAGRTHMDGATALAFVRSRHGTGDRDRTKRQQAVILALARKAKAHGLRGLPGLWRRAQPFVDSDLEADDALYYGSFALEQELSAIGGFSIGGEMIDKHVTEDGKHVLLLDRQAFDRALAGLFDGELPALRGRKQCPDAEAALEWRAGKDR